MRNKKMKLKDALIRAHEQEKTQKWVSMITIFGINDVPTGMRRKRFIRMIRKDKEGRLR